MFHSFKTTLKFYVQKLLILHGDELPAAQQVSVGIRKSSPNFKQFSEFPQIARSVCLRAQALTNAAVGSVPINRQIFMKLVTNFILLEAALRVSACDKVNIVTVQIPVIGVILHLFRRKVLYITTDLLNLMEGI